MDFAILKNRQTNAVIRKGGKADRRIPCLAMTKIIKMRKKSCNAVILRER